MKLSQILVRWMPTFLAFPLAGLLASLAMGPIKDLLSAAVAGAMVGAVLGLAQWWALKPLAISFDWVWSTAVATMVASPLAWALTSYSTSVETMTMWGLIAGAVVGFGQIATQKLGLQKTLAWTALVAAAWSLAWFISASVIVDIDSNYAIFGSTGALAATTLLAIFLNPILGRKRG